VWDLKTQTKIISHRGHSAEVASICFSPNGELVASGSYSKENSLKLWNLVTMKEIPIESHSQSVRSVNFSPDGQTLLSGSWDGEMRMSDAYTGAKKASIVGHLDEVRICNFTSDGMKVVSASDDKTVKVWDVGNGSFIELAALTGHTHWVEHMGFINQSLLYSGSNDEIIVWDLVSLKMVQKLPVLQMYTAANYGNKLALGFNNGKVVFSEFLNR